MRLWTLFVLHLLLVTIPFLDLNEGHRMRGYRPLARARARARFPKRRMFIGSGLHRHQQRTQQGHKYVHKNTNPIYGMHSAKAKDHAIINGQYLDTNRILIQKRTYLGVGYFAYGVPKIPVFIRREREMNKKYIVFQDPYLPPGEGYLVVLKRVPLNTVYNPRIRLMTQGSQIPIPQEIPYEAFHMVLGNNIHGSFKRVNVRRFAYGVRTHFFSRAKARKQLSQWRKLMSHSFRRFGMSRWRGKRDTTSEHFSYSAHNVSLEDYVRVFRHNGNHFKPNPCEFRPLNVSKLRLKLKSMETFQNASSNLDFDDFNENVDFHYVM